MTYKVAWADLRPQIDNWYEATIASNRTDEDPIIVEMNDDKTVCNSLVFKNQSHYLLWMLKWS